MFPAGTRAGRGRRTPPRLPRSVVVPPELAVGHLLGPREAHRGGPPLGRPELEAGHGPGHHGGDLPEVQSVPGRGHLRGEPVPDAGAGVVPQEGRDVLVVLVSSPFQLTSAPREEMTWTFFQSFAWQA